MATILPQNYAGLRTGQIDMMLADTGTLALARNGKDFNALFAPYVNSYPRLSRNTAAPINIEWGYDNRTVGIRSPISSAAARRASKRSVNSFSCQQNCITKEYFGAGKNGMWARLAASSSAFAASSAAAAGWPPTGVGRGPT